MITYELEILRGHGIGMCVAEINPPIQMSDELGIRTTMRANNIDSIFEYVSGLKHPEDKVLVSGLKHPEDNAPIKTLNFWDRWAENNIFLKYHYK